MKSAEVEWVAFTSPGNYPLRRLVALKLIEPGDLDSPELRKRFRRKAEAAAKCQHPNLAIRRGVSCRRLRSACA